MYVKSPEGHLGTLQSCKGFSENMTPSSPSSTSGFWVLDVLMVVQVLEEKSTEPSFVMPE